jgi:hypothetical protein
MIKDYTTINFECLWRHICFMVQSTSVSASVYIRLEDPNPLIP